MRRRAIALAICLVLSRVAWAERPEIPPGHVRYIVVVRDASTIPHPADRPAPTEVEPRFAEHGARLEHSRGEVRIVTLPEPAVERLKLDPAVLYVQKVWDGRPLSAPPPVSEPSRVILNPSSDATEQVGADQKVSWKSGDYQYDGSGNIWAIGADRYYYDYAGRLVEGMLRGQTEKYSYDAFGNLVSKVTPGFASTFPVVDSNTNRWRDYEYDVAGNLARGDRDIYTYDSLNMLVKIGGTSFPPRFIYTPDDERIGIQQNDGWTRWKVRDFSGRVIREYEGDTGNSWLWVQDYMYAEGRLVAGWRENAVGGQINFHTDHLGSVRLITNVMGWKVSAQEYWPFGQEQTPTNQEAAVFAYARPEPMKFTGHERDYLGAFQYDNIDYLDYMHAREYSPLRGRFLSVDPGQDWDIHQPQSWNMYSYVRNSPVNRTDPTGRYVESPLDVAILLVDVGIGIYETYKTGEVSDTTKAAVAADLLTLATPGAFGGGLLVRGGAVAVNGARGLETGARITQVGTKLNQAAAQMSSEGGGGRTDRKVSRDAMQNGRDKVNNLRTELQKMKSTPNKTPEIKKAIDAKERELRRAMDQLKASEEHARVKQR